MDAFTAVLFLFVVLGMAAEHYFPYWIFIVGSKLPSPPRLIVNYVAGTLVWLGAFSVWLSIQGLGRLALMAWAFAGAAGVTVCLLYAYDHSVSNKQAAQDRREQVDLLERRKHESGKGR